MLLNEEKDFVRRLKDGDSEAFLILYNHYHGKLFNFCSKYISSREEINEVLQIVFITLWEQHSQLDDSKSFSSYLFSIAKYKVFHAFRSRLYYNALIDNDISSEKFGTYEVLDEIFYNDLKEKINNLIEELPLRRKMIFRLNRFYGLTYQLIAQKLNISENTVDTQMRKSIQYLKERYRLMFK